MHLRDGLRIDWRLEADLDAFAAFDGDSPVVQQQLVVVEVRVQVVSYQALDPLDEIEEVYYALVAGIDVVEKVQANPDQIGEVGRSGRADHFGTAVEGHSEIEEVPAEIAEEDRAGTVLVHFGSEVALDQGDQTAEVEGQTVDYWDTGAYLVD